MITTDWIEWGGGNMPVPEGALVDVRYRFGTIITAVRAGQYPDADGAYLAKVWEHCNSPYDIVAYRAYYANKLGNFGDDSVKRAIAKDRVETALVLIDSIESDAYKKRCTKTKHHLSKLLKEIEEDLG